MHNKVIRTSEQQSFKAGLQATAHKESAGNPAGIVKAFTSESVTCGHPDKICDQIADRILDELISQDPDAHVACEVTCATDEVHVFGEITAEAKADYEGIAREVIERIGYTEPGQGFDAASCSVRVSLHEQSPDIARGVRRKTESEQLDNGAGDQGMMFGFACRETDALMPLPIELAHALTRQLELVRRNGELPCLRPDGKSQVTVEYEGDRPKRISTVLISAQHREGVGIEALPNDIIAHVITPALPVHLMDKDTHVFVNPTGRFVVGGPAGDSGLTGRKIIVDTYGGYARHGGGSFSGKDPSKVDRTGAYMARYIAKNIVASHLADRCEVQLSYAIGLAAPVSLLIDTFGTEQVPLSSIYTAVNRAVDLRPAAIIRRFGLDRPIYSRVSCYGHFGSNALLMPWEQTDLELRV